MSGKIIKTEEMNPISMVLIGMGLMITGLDKIKKKDLDTIKKWLKGIHNPVGSENSLCVNYRENSSIAEPSGVKKVTIRPSKILWRLRLKK